MKQLAVLAFYASNPGWHSYHSNTKTQIYALVGKGFLEINDYGQARFTGKVFAQ